MSKKLIRLFFVTAVVILLFTDLTEKCRACYSIVVGKKASVDGGVIMAHNEDDGPPQIVNHHKIPRKNHIAAEEVTLRNGGRVAQVRQTWAYIWSEMPGMLFSDSYLNEWGVCVASDNCPSRQDKPEITDGGIGYMLRRLVAERAKTAREGVLLAGRLVERFGYIDSGRTYIICDPNEGWLFCVVNGKHWMAQRVKDNEIAMVANTYTIRRVDLSDDKNFLASKDIVEYAVSRGWYSPEKDGAFDFAAVYSNPNSASSYSNFGRQWSGLNYVTAKSIKIGPNLPFSVVPKGKVSVADIMRILRHDYRGTVVEALSTNRSPEKTGTALCNDATQTSFVAQLRNKKPLDIGLVYWMCLSSPRTSFYIPYHFGISEFPEGFSLESQRPSKAYFDKKLNSPFQVNPLEPFWMFSNFRRKVSDTSIDTISKVKTIAVEIENDALTKQSVIEEAARRLYSRDKKAAVQILTDYSDGIYRSSMEAMQKVLVKKGQAKVMTDIQMKKKANELAKEYMIIDTHQDVPYRLLKKMEDISQRTEGGDFDYPRARQGGLDVVFMAVYVPAEYEDTGGARAFADMAINKIEGLAQKWPDKFIMAGSVKEVKEQFGGDRISIALGMENGSPIEGDLDNLKYFYDRGIRYITLAHSECNHICDSSFDEKRTWNGLSPFGVEVVAEMNRLGMLIDVSHVSDKTFYQIMELSKAPVAATHSSCRHFTPGWERNMDDDMIKLLAEKGGVIQINFGSMFLSEKINKAYQLRSKKVSEYFKTNNVPKEEKDKYIEEYVKKHPLGDADISDVVAHIDHVVKLVGIEHVGLGSDFDGVGGQLPVGLKDVSCYPNLIYELLKKGYTGEDIKKICAGNFLRVWSDVERTARQLQSVK
ncbi:MAG: membrane dipeptidase [Sedimentisphaerales bacterium]|nr:membrane dipeptidase [Sedimentisphaerales bacterium]